MSRYRLVFPIIGLAFFYIGKVLLSLASLLPPEYVLLDIAMWSLLSLIGLALRDREVIMVGSALLILGSGPPIYFRALSASAYVGLSILGTALMMIGNLFQILTIIAWFKEK